MVFDEHQNFHLEVESVSIRFGEISPSDIKFEMKVLNFSKFTESNFIMP